MPSDSMVTCFHISEKLEKGVNCSVGTAGEPKRLKKHIPSTKTHVGTIHAQIMKTVLLDSFPFSRHRRTAEIIFLLVNSKTSLKGEVLSILSLKKTIAVQFGPEENILWKKLATRESMAHLVSKPEDLRGVVKSLEKILSIETKKVCDTTMYCMDVERRTELFINCHCMKCEGICRFGAKNISEISGSCLDYCSDDPHFKALDKIYVDNGMNITSGTFTNKKDHTVIIVVSTVVAFIVLVSVVACYCICCKPKKLDADEEQPLQDGRNNGRPTGNDPPEEQNPLIPGGQRADGEPDNDGNDNNGGRPDGEHDDDNGGRPDGEHDDDNGGRPDGEHDDDNGGRPDDEHDDVNGGRPDGEHNDVTGGRPDGEHDDVNDYPVQVENDVNGDTIDDDEADRQSDDERNQQGPLLNIHTQIRLRDAVNVPSDVGAVDVSNHINTADEIPSTSNINNEGTRQPMPQNFTLTEFSRTAMPIHSVTMDTC
ncbi:hypothetical protein ACF0H5_006409 [Mactra antiquata]